MPTPIRGVRVPDDLWQAAQARAEQDGTTVSKVLVDALTAYARPEWPRPGAGGVHVVLVADDLWSKAAARADRDEVSMDTVIVAALGAYAEPPPVFPIKMPLRPACYDVDWPTGTKDQGRRRGRTS